MATKNSKNHKKTTTKRRPANSARKIQNKKSPANPLTREITFLIIIVLGSWHIFSHFIFLCVPDFYWRTKAPKHMQKSITVWDFILGCAV